MDWLVLTLMPVIFIAGCCVGSFLNVLIYRIPADLSISGRSFCPKCKKKISWRENIPLVSFFLLHKRCKNCHSPISWQYPIVELITGILFVLTVFLISNNSTIEQFNNLIPIIYYLFIVSCLVVIFFTDLKYGIIPDKITYPAIIISFIFLISQYPNILISNLLSGVAASLFLLMLHLITRGRGMGFGDVKLALLMGIFLGSPGILISLYASFLTGAVVSLILILAGLKRFGQTIPFGPFLVLGTLIALLIS